MFFNKSKLNLNSFLYQFIIVENKIEDLKQKYSESDVNSLISSIPKLQKSPTLLSYILKIKGSEPIEDVIPTLKLFFSRGNQLKINDLTKYKSISDLRAALDSELKKKNEIKSVKSSESTKIYEDSEILVIFPHTTESSCLYGKGTTWCTAATESGNMFLSYSAGNNNTFLYYIIQKQENPLKNPNAKLSVRIQDGEIQYGENGGLSVNSRNEGINKKDLKRILGDRFSNIMHLIQIHYEGVKEKHPAKTEIQGYTQNLVLLKQKLSSFKQEEWRVNFLETS